MFKSFENVVIPDIAKHNPIFLFIVLHSAVKMNYAINSILLLEAKLCKSKLCKPV